MTDERANRILSSAAELLTEHEDWTLRQGIDAAIMLDLLLYGSDSPIRPVGLLGKSPISAAQALRESAQ